MKILEKKLSKHLSSLGNTYLSLGKYLFAEQCLEESLLLKQKLFGFEDSSTALTLDTLGTVLRNKGDLD